MNEALNTAETSAAQKDNVLSIRAKQQEELGKEVSIYEQKAQSMVVENDNDYALAGEMVKQVKAFQKRVEDYWEPMRKSTYEAYQSVNTHKKQMLDPMKNAEKILKSKMSGFSIKKEQERRAKEAELRRKAQEEAERKLAEAVAAEESGDSAAAEYAMAEAEVMDTVAVNGAIPQEPTPKVSGVSKTKSWEITEIDSERVPISVAGTEIRPVDEKAIMRLIKASKGQIEIPGVTYKETYNISVRA